MKVQTMATWIRFPWTHALDTVWATTACWLQHWESQEICQQAKSTVSFNSVFRRKGASNKRVGKSVIDVNLHVARSKGF